MSAFDQTVYETNVKINDNDVNEVTGHLLAGTDAIIEAVETFLGQKLLTEVNIAQAVTDLCRFDADRRSIDAAKLADALLSQSGIASGSSLIAAHSEQVKRLSDEVTLKSDESAAKEQTIAALRAKIAQLEGNVTALKAEVTSLKTKPRANGVLYRNEITDTEVLRGLGALGFDELDIVNTTIENKVKFYNAAKGKSLNPHNGREIAGIPAECLRISQIHGHK